MADLLRCEPLLASPPLQPEAGQPETGNGAVDAPSRLKGAVV
jgi:hypothetical protein